ncbi:transposable element Tcb2 transposase [Trichonephila clavipes]|nr:transposable element Tcb2 transposase [Trichonephila clavipes]
MSQRRRLPNSLRWRAVGWMEMGLLQADAARRLNVSRSVVQRLWDQYQSEDSVSRRPVPGRPRATTPAEDRFLALSARRRRTTTVPQLVADHFQASGRRISATTVRNRLHNAGLYARRPVVCVPLNGRHALDTINPTLLKDSYRGGGILVWAAISLGGHTDLHVFHGGTVTGLRYRDEILDPYVRPYAAAIGNDFILMHDNARPHRARIVEEYLEDHVEHKEKSFASSLDFLICYEEEGDDILSRIVTGDETWVSHITPEPMGVLLLHDNARPYTSRTTRDLIETFG